MHRSLFAALLLALTACVASPALAAGVYKWLDNNGKTHFGDRPPADASQSREVKIKDIPQADRRATGDAERNARQNLLLQSFEEQRAKKKQAAAEQQKRKKELARRCVLARHNLKLFNQASYLYDLDDSGNKALRSDADRDKAIRELEKTIKKHCN